ncbi:MAG TPA: gluconate 2-dehydrogenase subunit 3 family protein [Bryobacteraceae bacterium]|nr:gluconate 2-dehydrogenase subunit 3 family protein [Bryobacteraceae bacterium]
MKRRDYLTVTVGGLIVYTLDRMPGMAQGRLIRVPLRFFTEPEALIIAAAAARIFPSDESGPGANEAGVIIYIDRQLAGPYGRGRYRYAEAPFEEGPPELGYQGKAPPREIYREGLALLGADFRTLTPQQQDERLRGMERSVFFDLLRTHTIEGMFCDPMHGGNADLIGWQLIGFPGPRMGYFDEVDTHHGRAFRPKPASLEQVMGRKVRPSEDEP